MHGAAFQGHAVIADVLLAHGVPLRDIHKDGYEPASKFMTKIISVFYPRIMFLWWIRAIFCDEPSTLEQVPMGILLNKSSDHSFSTRIVLFMFVTCAVRTCWGSEGRHLATLHWFLEKGVPLDDIYEICLAMTKNPDIEAFLQGRRAATDNEEL